MASVVSGALGQLFMKAGMLDLNKNNIDNLLNTLQTILLLEAETQHIFGVLWVLAGVACYLVAMLIWIYVLKHFELSMAYPLLSIGYILVYLGAVAWPKIGEAFLWEKTTGILLIMLGVILIASPKETSTKNDSSPSNKASTLNLSSAEETRT